MTTAIAFDFATKTSEPVELSAIPDAIAAGRYCWLDIDARDDAAAALAGLNVDDAVTGWIGADHRQGQLHLGQRCIHVALAEAGIERGALALRTVHVVLGHGFIATYHRHESELLEAVRANHREDFQSVAESGGFLLFEIVDHLILGYRETLAALSHGVDDIQQRLLGDVGDGILAEVSELTRALLEYRNAVVVARETVHELATRRSAYVPESTQPFLDRQSVPLERLAGDAATERTVLSESLSLYMGIVSHRTNRLVNQLTVVSLIFLPLNFLAAVYGMNFKEMPELNWAYGYFAFWAVTAVLVAVLLFLIRRRRWF